MLDGASVGFTSLRLSFKGSGSQLKVIAGIVDAIPAHGAPAPVDARDLGVPRGEELALPQDIVSRETRFIMDTSENAKIESKAVTKSHGQAIDARNSLSGAAAWKTPMTPRRAS